MNAGAASGLLLNSPHTCKSLTQQMASLSSAKLWEPVISSVAWGLMKLNCCRQWDVGKMCNNLGRKRHGRNSLFQRYPGRKHWWSEWSPPLGSCRPPILGSCQWSDAPGGQTHRRKGSSEACNIFISWNVLIGSQQPTSSSAYRSCLFFTHFFEALRSCLSLRCLFKARTQALDFIQVQLVFSLNMARKKEDTYTSVCSVESAGTISGSVFSSSAWQRSDSTLECKRNSYSNESEHKCTMMALKCKEGHYTILGFSGNIYL